MKENIRIIIVFTIACFLIEVSSNNQNNGILIPNRETPSTNLHLFIKDVSTLTTLTKGILFQSKLADHFEIRISEYFHASRKSFIGLQRIKPEAILSAIVDFYEKTRKLKFTTDFQAAIRPVKLLESLSEVTLSQWMNCTNMTLIEEFIQTMKTLKSNIPDMTPPKFYFLYRIDTCLLSEISLKEVESCYKDLKQVNRVNTAKFFLKAKEHLESLHLIKKLISDFHNIEKLELVIEGAFQFSIKTFIESLSLYLKYANDELIATEPILKGKAKSIGKAMKRAIFGHEIKADEASKKQKIEFFEIFNSTFLKEILGEKKMKKLKMGFEPIRKYSEALDNIEKILKKLEKHKKKVKQMRSIIEIIEEWEEKKRFSISDSLLNTIKTCTKSIPEMGTVANNRDKFMSRFGYSKKLVYELEEYIGLFEDLLGMEDMILKGIDKLEAKVNKWESENWHQKKVNLANLLKKNDTKEINKIHSSIPLFQKLQFTNWRFEEQIRDIKDLNILTEILNGINVSNFISVSYCFSEKNFAHGRVSEILEGAKELKKYSERIKEPYLNSSKTYMRGVSKILSLLKSAKNATKKGLSSETMYLNGFEQKEEVDARLENGLYVMKTISNVQKENELLQKVLDSNFQSSDDFWKNWTTEGRNKTMKTIEEVKKLDEFIGGSRNKSLSNVGSVFKEATKIPGLIVFDGFDEFKQHVKDVKEAEEVVESFENIKYLDLDFTHHTKELQSAADSIGVLETFFNGLYSPEIRRNETFKEIKSKETYWRFKPIPWFQIAFLFLGAISLIVTSSVIICSLTPYGRKRWKQIYLERFASDDVLELHWRYSYWLDQESDKNALCEAVREVNFEQVKSLINKGVFINVYNSFGNTPLHAAAKYGHVKIVELLIKNGSDRKAFNYENKTPEQLLSESVETTTRMTSVTSQTSVSEGLKKSQMTENEKFSEIEKIFERNQGKIFRQRVPDLLPTMSYRIRIDTRLTDDSYDAFLEVYKGNVTDQLSGVTHFIVPTDKNGVFVSDDFGYIMCVFLPTLLMQKQWMSACLEKKSNFRNDYKFRVERVKYKGVAYDTVLKWSQWIHKQKLPFLFGVHIYVAVKGMAETEKIQLKQLVEMHGATWCDDIQNKENYNIGSHPYHHFNFGPLFIIHDGKKNLDHLKHDKDKMYTLMTFDQFVGFMLKLECHYDPERKIPIPVTTILDKSE